MQTFRDHCKIKEKKGYCTVYFIYCQICFLEGYCKKKKKKSMIFLLKFLKHFIFKQPKNKNPIDGKKKKKKQKLSRNSLINKLKYVCNTIVIDKKA